MTWDRIESFLRDLFSPMPGAQITILRVIIVILALGLLATWRGWLHGLRGWLWAALALTVGGIIIATLAFRMGDRPPRGLHHSKGHYCMPGLDPGWWTRGYAAS